MRFDYKEVPVPKWARKRLPDPTTAKAFKVRKNGEKEPIGIVLGFTAQGQQAWAFGREGKVFGGYTDKGQASEALAGS